MHEERREKSAAFYEGREARHRAGGVSGEDAPDRRRREAVLEDPCGRFFAASFAVVVVGSVLGSLPHEAAPPWADVLLLACGVGASCLWVWALVGLLRWALGSSGAGGPREGRRDEPDGGRGPRRRRRGA